MDMSYQEKSILGSLLAMVVVYGSTSQARCATSAAPTSTAAALGRLIFTVIAIVVIEIVYHIALAIEGASSPRTSATS